MILHFFFSQLGIDRLDDGKLGRIFTVFIIIIIKEISIAHSVVKDEKIEGAAPLFS